MMTSCPPPPLPYPVLGLVMAAGVSRRFGPSDKRLARLPHGQSLLASTVGRLQQHLPQLRVVLREDDDPHALALPVATDIIGVRRSEAGLGASIAEAVTHLRQHDPTLPNITAIAILLGDMPCITAATLDTLCRHATAERIIRPSWQGRPGHPVLFGRHWWPALERLDGDRGARVVLQQHASQVMTLAVHDPGICHDLDYPHDLRRSPPLAPHL